MLPVDVMLPQPTRVALVWKERFLGISRTTQANGWGLLLSDQRLIGPENLLTPPVAAVGGVASLLFDGNTITVSLDESDVVGGLAQRELPNARASGWPRDHIRAMTSPEDCLVVFGGIDSTRSLPATRLKIEVGQITIDPSFTLPNDAHGASVIATRDGNLVGIVAIESGRTRLLDVPSLVDQK